MNRRFIVRPLAEADLEDAARWYDDERAGLAERFVKDVDIDVLSDNRTPTAIPDGRRRCPPSIAAHVPVRRLLSDIRRRSRGVGCPAPEKKPEGVARTSTISASQLSAARDGPDRTEGVL